jgi:hypothetical protein
MKIVIDTEFLLNSRFEEDGIMTQNPIPLPEKSLTFQVDIYKNAPA